MHEKNSRPFSVIIPLSPEEQAWKNLCSLLLCLPEDCEVIFVRPTKLTKQEKGYLHLLQKKMQVNWLISGLGRAIQMNHGAKHAQCDVLWFLHADSFFSPNLIARLSDNLQDLNQKIYFFKLGFQNSSRERSYRLIDLNAWGANFRSRKLQMPFGDQGLCMAKELFMGLGMFDENCLIGEDNKFIWLAKKRGVSLKEIDATIYTSQRKYQEKGWLRTSVSHLYYTVKQGAPYYFDKIMKKL